MNTIINNIILIIILFIVYNISLVGNSVAQVCVVPPNGVIAWWSGDQDFSDMTGNNSLTLVGDPLAAAPGHVGNAFAFDGNDRLDTGLSLPIKGSVEFWLQVSNLTNAVEGIFGTFSPSGSNRLWIDAEGPGGYYDGDSLRSNFGNNYSADIKIEPVPSEFSDGDWVHLAVTFDYGQSPGTFEFYYNGVKVDSLTASRPYPAGHITFGGETGSYQTFFLRGKLDEVTVYDRILTADEIQAIADAGSAGKCKTLDADGDGLDNQVDNCPGDFNPSQENQDNDALGDVCDICPNDPSDNCADVSTCPDDSNTYQLDGIVGWWPGDVDGTDLSNSSSHATLQNGAQAGVTGMADGAFQFDGIDDAVDTPLILPPQGTIEFWVQPTNLSSVHIIVGTFGTANGNDRLWFAARGPDGWPAGSGRNTLRVNLGSSQVADINIPSPLSVGVWTHLALAYDYPNGVFTIYADGIQQQSVNAIRPAPSQPLSIGVVSSDFGQQFPFNGLVDEVTVYDRILSANEIQAIVDAGSTGKCKTLDCPHDPSDNCGHPNICPDDGSAHQIAGIVGWWPGNGTPKDVQNGNNGTLINGATFATGKVGEAFQFDGVDDKVTVANEPAFDFTSQVSVEAWIFSAGHPTNYQGLINKGYYSNGPFELRMTRQSDINSTNLGCPGTHALFFDVTTNNGLKSAFACLTKGVWYHVAGTYDGEMVRLYLNGEIVTSPNGTKSENPHSGTLIENDTPVNIGWNGSGGEIWSGLIDEVGIYNRALHASEVQAIYNAGSGGKCALSDADADGLLDAADNCPGNVNPDQEDLDSDGTGDVCDVCPNDPFNDGDGDGICGDVDNCTNTANSDQADMDGNGVGDACNDADDSDGDEFETVLDNCPDVFNVDQSDVDHDSFGDACDVCPRDIGNDADGDGVCESNDNCKSVANANQIDTDQDGTGDRCDADDDNDGVTDDLDNCPLMTNLTQEDFDSDGAGDVCDADDDNDGLLDAQDRCLSTAVGAIVNQDGCGIADLCPCNNPWKNHGAYVSCVADASGDFIELGLMTEIDKDTIVSVAGESTCGHKNK